MLQRHLDHAGHREDNYQRKPGILRGKKKQTRE